jgi:hypothetical protein
MPIFPPVIFVMVKSGGISLLLLPRCRVHSCVEVHQDEHTEISISEQIRRRLIVIMTARILQIIVGLAGLCALVLGLVIWIANIDLT